MDEQEEEKTAEVDIEGDRYNWWYVCEECHGILYGREKTCPWCKVKLDWSGFNWK